MTDLKQFLSSKSIEENLKEIVLAFSEGCKLVQRELINYEKSNSIDIGKNASGDIQKPIDIRCNNVIISCLEKTKGVFYLTSEEEDRTKLMYNGPLNPFPKNIYSVAFDPLDGSDNVDCSGGVGTIFGIYKERNEHCQSGQNIVCSGYAIYSNPVIFVLTFGEEVYEFNLRRDNFIKTPKNLVIPSNPKKIFSGNIGNSFKWHDKERHFYERLISEREKYTFRYSGCMILDVHRILCRGGIFIYPGDKKNSDGKLRLFYECMPISFIIESANGIAYDGKKRILDNMVFNPHQKTPIFIGCKRDVILHKHFYGISNFTKGFIIESFHGSGEDEMSVDEGELIKDFNILNDKNWSRVTSNNGNTGIIPTKCLYLENY